MITGVQPVCWRMHGGCDTFALTLLLQDEDGNKKRAEERFRKLKVAYEILRDPEKRRQYDNGERVT